jgi:hypothetical protein
MGERRYAYSLLVGKPEGKRPLGRPSHRWVDNIMMDLKRDRMGEGRIHCISLVQDRDKWNSCE